MNKPLDPGYVDAVKARKKREAELEAERARKAAADPPPKRTTTTAYNSDHYRPGVTVADVERRMISLLVCRRCAALVPGDQPHVDLHDLYHEQLRLLRSRES